MDKMTCTTKLFFQTCRIVFFDDIHRNGRHKLSVWKYVQAITVTLNTRKTLYIAIPWSDILDRKSTRLNSSHVKISYAVFCLKKEMRDSRYVSLPLAPPPPRSTLFPYTTLFRSVYHQTFLSDVPHSLFRRHSSEWPA